MTILRVHLVRHGETEANRQQIVQGQLDTELNELGHKQAGLVAKRLRHVPFEIAFSSDLSRAKKTAEAILSYHQGVTLEEQKDLRERFMGNLQGKEWAFKMAGPVDETIERSDVFIKRINRWWEKHLASLPPKPDETAHEMLVVSHGGVIGTLVRSLIRQQRLKCGQGVLVLACQNTSVSVIEVEMDGKGVVKEYGNVSHLEGMSELTLLKTNVDEGVLRN
ncbi:phosphoglycerate mutase-like protein [Amanita muscaria]